MKLILGVMDVPYSEGGGETTGEVAQILEDNYGVIAFFIDAHEKNIANALAESFSGALDTILKGGNPDNPFQHAGQDIEHEFRMFLDNKEMDGAPGVPTLASLIGTSSRTKDKKIPGRPSFMDTGLYQQSFRSWIE